MDPLERVLELLALLQGTPVWSAADLADRLGTTTRTVRRDVSRLRGMGYRISSEPGRYGGYRLDRGRAVPPLLLTPDEAVALAIGLRLAGPAGIDRLDEAADAALTKLESVLPPTAWSRVVALDTATVRDPVPPTEPVDPDVLAVCAAAIGDRQRLRLDYRSASNDASTRRVDATALVQTERRWYLVAFDLTREGWRSFRVDRVTAALAVGPADPPDPPPDPIDLVREGTAVRAYPWQAEVVVRGPAAWVRAAVPPSVARVEPLDDQRSLLRTGGHDLDMIAALVAGLGLEVKVRHPPELTAALHRLGRRLLDLT
ncbi:WYL domain-containing protein [soil metagenome]